MVENKYQLLKYTTLQQRILKLKLIGAYNRALEFAVTGRSLNLQHSFGREERAAWVSTSNLNQVCDLFS